MITAFKVVCAGLVTGQLKEGGKKSLQLVEKKRKKNVNNNQLSQLVLLLVTIEMRLWSYQKYLVGFTVSYSTTLGNQK